jgi:fatty acid desaturase
MGPLLVMSPRIEIAEGRNTFILLFVVAGNILCLAASATVFQESTLLFALLLLVFSYCSLLTWLIIHECIHYSLFRQRPLNVLTGRAISVLFGCSFHVLRAGHLMHHKHNRSEVEPSELVFETPRNPALRWVEHYGWIFGLFHIGQMLFPLILPFRRTVMARAARGKRRSLENLLQRLDRTFWSAAFDGCLCLAYLVLLVVLNVESLWALALMLYGRALTISFHDNLYHYGTTPRDPFAAYNLHAHRVFQRVLLNSNYHRTHHRYPRVPWDRLPQTFVAAGDRFDERFAKVVLKQLQGPIAAGPISKPNAEAARASRAG